MVQSFQHQCKDKMAVGRSLMQVGTALDKLLSRFPENHCPSLGFAYGSAVFPQAGDINPKSNMIDFIFAVNDPLEWHRENIKKNSSDYSFLKYGRENLVTHAQKNYGAKVYFNTLVPVQDKVVKYGVISTNDLIEDLMHWNTLYVSGRLHKPVDFIYKAENEQLSKALDTNLKNAFHAALLCLPEKFSEEDLFITIAGLSYSGDFRMLFGEDRNKVQNIVKPRIKSFYQLYEPIIKTMNDLVITSGYFEHDTSMAARLRHLNNLPKTVRETLAKSWNKDGRLRDTEDVLYAIANDSSCDELVLKAIQEIVWKYSWTQSIKGILMAGIFKACRYSGQKVIKMLRSLIKYRATVVR